MKVRAGTSGFSYKEWKGNFYPSDLPAARMLEFYASRLSAVEINNTFYRMPKPERVADWAARVPDGFRFAFKAHRRITHHKRLRGTEEDVAYSTKVLGQAGGKLGAVLYQLPPNFQADLDRLHAFCEGLPSTLPAVFEFRHPSWDDDSVSECLLEHGCFRVVADTDEGTPPSVLPRGRLGYWRLRREAYTPPDLDAWEERARAGEWDELYCFFKHEDAGTGPLLAEVFLSRF